MTTPTSYTSEEAATILKAVMLSGMAVSIADLGIVSTAIEATALASEVTGAAKKYPNNSIIQAVFSEEALRAAHPNQSLKKVEITPENALDLAIGAVNEALTILSPKASPEEVGEFKAFIHSAAEHVANAAGSGLFGSGNPKVSDKEMVALDKLKVALEV